MPERSLVLRCGARGLVLGWLLLIGCGGKARSTGVEGQGGTSSSGGSASSGATQGEGAPFVLDDNHPWFDSSGVIDVPDSQSDEVLHFSIAETPARATLSTHNIFDLLSMTHAVRFSARASAPLRLLVSASHTIQAYDYFAARDAGAHWPVAAVDVGVDWQHFTVPLADMQPPEMLVGGPPSFFLAFIVEHPVPVEAWIDEVWFE
jgi:hypothetical protein